MNHSVGNAYPYTLRSRNKTNYSAMTMYENKLSMRAKVFIISALMRLH